MLVNNTFVHTAISMCVRLVQFVSLSLRKKNEIVTLVKKTSVVMAWTSKITWWYTACSHLVSRLLCRLCDMSKMRVDQLWCGALVGNRDWSENTNSPQGPSTRVINGLTGYDESGTVFCLFFVASGIEQSSELLGYHKQMMSKMATVLEFKGPRGNADTMTMNSVPEKSNKQKNEFIL